jgi:hypothetical protein
MVKDLVCDCGLDATIGAESRVQFPLVTSYICDLYDYIVNQNTLHIIMFVIKHEVI